MKPRIIFSLWAVLCAAMVVPARAELVMNGGFEDNDGTNFVGWVIAGTGISVDSTFPANGTFDAALATLTGDTGTLSQSLVTTAGTPYLLTFALFDQAGLPFDSFTVTFGRFSAVITGDAAPSYTTMSFLVLGGDITGALTTLSFEGTNDFAAWNLDDVSVVSAVPEPSGGLLLAASVLALPLMRRGRTGRPRTPDTVAG